MRRSKTYPAPIQQTERFFGLDVLFCLGALTETAESAVSDMPAREHQLNAECERPKSPLTGAENRALYCTYF